MKEPARLGRGLASLFGDAPTPGGDTVGLTPVDILEPNPFQPRGAIAQEDLAELAASIRAQGVLQPILIRRHPGRHGRFQIVAGERRWRAAQLAGLTQVPTFTRDLPDSTASAAALVENLQRQDLNAIEEAEGYKRLVTDFGLTQETLSQAVGKSRSHVANLLRLLHLPASVVQHVRSGALTAGHARAALACADPARAAETMVQKGLNVRQAEALATAKPPRTPSSRPKPSRHADPDLCAMEADLAEHLGLEVQVVFNGRGGSITLHYHTLDQLDHIVARLGR